MKAMNLRKAKMLVALVPIAAGLLMSGVPALAHHSAGPTYDLSATITIKGEIIEVLLRSPHSFFFVEAEDSKGVVQRWAVEGAAAPQFARQGVVKDSFKAGDPVEVVACPARAADSYRVLLRKITRTTDGKTWGSAPGETVE